MSKKGSTISIANISPEDIVEAADKSFIKLFWKDVPGPGIINKQRNVRYKGDQVGPVVSVKIIEGANSELHIEVWMSEWTSQLFGLVVHGANIAFFQNKKTIRTLGKL